MNTDSLAFIFPTGEASVSFKYDPFGRRIYKSSSGGTSIYAYDDRGNLIEEATATGAVAVRYSHGLGIDEPLAMLRGGTTTYYQADGFGSVTSLTNSAGAAAQTYTYDSFGNIVATTGSLVNSYRYTGRELDTETSLYYYRARYYDQSAGRFLNEDQFRWAENGNFYAYVRNRPLYFRDPSGWLSIGPGFSPQCLADVLSAIQILKQRAKSRPCCENYFMSQGLHMPLDTMLDSPLFTVNFDPNGNVKKREKKTLAYTNGGGDAFDVFVTPLGCGTGPTHLAQDLVHELAHLSLGHSSVYYDYHPLPEKPDHAHVQQAEAACGFAIQTDNVTTVVVTPQ